MTAEDTADDPHAVLLKQAYVLLDKVYPPRQVRRQGLRQYHLVKLVEYQAHPEEHSALQQMVNTLRGLHDSQVQTATIHAPYAQFFPPKPEQNPPLPTGTVLLTTGAWLEQAQDLLNTACPPSAPLRADLRRDFLKQLAEYKKADPVKPPTPVQQQALQGIMQTLRDIQASSTNTTSNPSFGF